ncbi:COP9 signalosome complex subunit 7b [Yarrowia sp. C11]|nr:COP9 signalosome complex subunit 7b [Yarrowia sp. E02]KAG5369776.1 COP9 signalosome complex subunit 7b [Yarrowia sp. C11]
MEELRALIKTQPRPLSPRIVHDLIQQALTSRHIFSFGELLDLDEIAQGAQDDVWIQTLRIFAYGTWTDYVAQKESVQLPELTDKQATKLRQLSIISLITDDPSVQQQGILRYHDIAKAVGLSGESELEDLAIDCIYRGLFQGRINSQLHLVEECRLGNVERDVSPAQAVEIEAALTELLNRSQTVLDELEQSIKQVEQDAHDRNVAVQQYNQLLRTKPKQKPKAATTAA